MSNTLECTNSCGLKWAFEKADEIGVARDARTAKQATVYEQGTGAGKANVIYRAQIHLTLGYSVVDVDLKTALDIYGDAAAMTTMRAIFAQNRATGAGDNVRIGPQGCANPLSAPWGSVAAGYNLLGPGGILDINNPIDGYAVTATAKTIRVQHSGITYPIDVDFAVLGVR